MGNQPDTAGMPERSLQQHRRLLAAIGKGLSQLGSAGDSGAPLQQLLENLVEIGGGQLGLIDEIRKGQRCRLATVDLSRAGPADEAVAHPAMAALERLAAAVEAEGQTVLVDGDQAGSPGQDSSFLGCHLGMPLMVGGELVGLACLAGRQGAFDHQTATFLEPLAVTCATIIRSTSGEQRWRDALAELRRSEQRLRTLFETEPDAIFLVDGCTAAIMDANPAAASLYGYTVDELRTLTAMDLTTEPGRIKEVIGATGKISAPLRYHRKKDGTIFPVEITACGLDLEGHLVSVATIRDITEQKRTEQALRASEERYRQVVVLSPDAILVHRDGVIVYANPAAARLLATATAKELLGYRMRDLLGVGAADPPTAKQPGQSGTFEQRLRRLDGSWIEVELTTTRIELERGPAMLTIGRDISERKRSEEELRKLENQLHQSQKMDAIGQLAGGVAHDFNNQLGVILGYAELLASRLEHDQGLKEYAELIVLAAEHSAGLTSQLLTFSRKQRLQRHPIDMHDLIEEVCFLLHRSIDKRISIIPELEAEQSVLTGDPAQLESALLNLALNARDAMPAGGELRFATANRGFGGAAKHPELAPGSYLQVAVTDTGTGINEETLGRIFEPFFTTKEPGKGTGMGLAAVYGTVKSHGGAIEVQSKVDAGTTLTIFLPLSSAGERDGEGVVDLLPDVVRAAHILVVDDEHLFRKTLSEMLMVLGHQVQACSDGVEAVERYRDLHQEIDLVILDMVMPKQSGKDTFLAMRRINPEVKVVLSTGYSIEGEAEQVLQLGALGLLEKPYRLEPLRRIINEVLRS